MLALQQEAVAACYAKLRPGNTMGDLLETVNAVSRDDYHCRLIMHARGLGDDSPIIVFSARDATMRDWPIEEHATFIIKPVVSTADHAKRVYWGDTVVATTDGAQRLGTRKPELIEIA